MMSDKQRYLSAIARAGFVSDDIRQWEEIRPGVWRILVQKHRCVWYRLTSDGRISPE